MFSHLYTFLYGHAAIITVGPHDISGPRWGTGSFGLNDFLGWSDWSPTRRIPAGSAPSCGSCGPGGWSHARPRACRSARRAERCSARARRGSSRGSNTPSTTTRSGRRLNCRTALDRTDDPGAVAHRLAGPVRRTDARAVPQAAQRGVPRRADRRVVDPLAHDDQGRADRAARVAGVARHSPRRATVAPQRSPVRIHVNRRADGSTSPDWPPPMPEQVRYLQPGGRLGDAVPPDTAPRRRRSPTTPRTRRPPSAAAALPGRRLPQRRQAGRARRRADASPAIRCRRISTSSAHPVVELVALVRQPAQRRVRPGQRGRRQGRSRNVSDGYRRRHRRFRHRARSNWIAVAHRFRAGSRIRVLVAGGSHPRFAAQPRHR